MWKGRAALFLFLLLLALGFTTIKSFSDEPTYDRKISFATTLGTLKFFDQTTGKIYKYSENDGKLMQIWVLEELGKDLKEEKITSSLFY